jgi:Family of unknown function (DUF6309)
MRVIAPSTAALVRQALGRGRDLASGSAPWTLGFLDQADRQFSGTWWQVELDGAAALGIILPPHLGEPCRGDRRELVPPGGASVRDVAVRLRSAAGDYARQNPECWSRIAQARLAPFSALILTTAPLALPEHATLTPRPGHLYHLDGFHRLIGWAIEGRLEGEPVRLEAFVAGGS